MERVWAEKAVEGATATWADALKAVRGMGVAAGKARGNTDWAKGDLTTEYSTAGVHPLAVMNGGESPPSENSFVCIFDYRGEG